MTDNEKTVPGINACLASACQASGAACCRKGKIFLPDAEHAAMRGWTEANREDALAEFDARTETHAGFRLLDQGERCLFLDDDGLCELHDAGVKPSECFWWPMHVYIDAAGEAEIRISESCCTAFRHVPPDSPIVDDVERKARELGLDLIARFRAVYGGSYENRLLRKIEVEGTAE